MKEFEAFIFDLDGCIYIGKSIIPGARDVMERLRELGKSVLFVTNNATKTPSEFASKLRSFGIKVSADDVLTSATATAMYLLEEFGKCAVYPVGGRGLTEELRRQGHRIVNISRIDEADTVVACLDFKFSYEKLRAASNVIRNGKRFIATNVDPVVPVEGGFLPGAGAIVSAITTATNKEPYVVGKPSKHMLTLAFRKLGASPEKTVVVGDRLDTDIKGGNDAGAFTLLVLSGATSADAFHKVNDLKFAPRLTLPNVGHMTPYLS
jgi:HAD superfamily hydrolase (TIGR01457 family)